jgi:uncharacterized protein
VLFRSGKSVWNYIMLHAHNPEGARLAGEKMFEITGMKPVSVVDISPVIGMHAGDGAVAISLLLMKPRSALSLSQRTPSS